MNTNPNTESQATNRVGGSVFRRLAGRYIVPGNTAVNSGSRATFDLEANGLLDTASKLHCISIADLDSDQVDQYRPEQIGAGLEHLSRLDYLVGHNILNYDLRLLRQLYDWTPKAGCAVVDTLVASRLILSNLTDLDDQAAAMGGPVLKKLRGSHSIEAWGLRLGMPKTGTDITDWSTWTPEMQARCVGDAVLCKKLYQFLKPDGYNRQALELEHRVAPICDEITATGVPFNIAAAEQLKQKWEVRCAELEAQLLQQFPGTNLNSRAQIGALLEARGWIPEKRTEKTGQPMINDELLETLPELYPEFTGLAEYLILSRRLAQLANGKEAWLKHISADGRIHGGLIRIGTPHFRAKHLNPNLAQVPNPKKGGLFAAECRALFRTNNDWVFVACDQANLQDRGFAHYLFDFDGGAYAKAFLEGKDQHWQSAIALVLAAEGVERNKDNKLHTAIREGAKRFRYAFLYGAGAEKAGRIIHDTTRAMRQIDSNNRLQQQFFGESTRPTQTTLKKVGANARNKFMDATPGLRKLREKLEACARRCGCLPGLDGRRVPVRALYTALNFIVTSSEAIICKRWLVQTYDELRARFRYGWDGDVVIVLWVHDEIVCACRPEVAAEVGELLARHAKEAGEFYGFKVPLDADYKIGRSWAGEPVEVSAPAHSAPSIIPEPALEPIAAASRASQVEATFQGAGMLSAVAMMVPAQSDEVPPWVELNNNPPQQHGSNGRAADGFDGFPDQKSGGKILCPFHDDHTPSLQIYSDGDDPHYHCFVCGAHGHLADLEVDWEAALKSPTGKPTDKPIDDDDARNLERAHELWDKAEPLAGTLAERYLAETRGIDVGALPSNINDALRFLPRCWLDGKYHPCLIALFRDIETGERAGIHRTWLTSDAQKIDRRMFGRWPRPRAIKLWPADNKLYVGEGIETVLAAATQLRMQPAWALGSVVYLEKFPIVSGIDELTILIDRDDHGEAAAETCCQTWQSAGRRVRRLRTKDASLNDFNDLILKTARADWDGGFEEIKEDSAADSGADSAADSGANNGAAPKTSSAEANSGAAPEPEPLWPVIAPEAYYGLAGEVITTLAPHTESDPVALLMHYLVYFGNCVGRVPYFQVESTRHFTNLFAVVAGATAKARKGTAAERIRRIFEMVDREWACERIHGGMSSGEGVIYAVRDPVYGTGKKIDEVIDPGIDDKRLLLDEREFYQALAVMKREGSILSRVLRDAWDCREMLATLTKHSPTCATGALISVIGHITIEELRETLDHTSIANGYSNRFLFTCVRRNKLLPHGGVDIDLGELAAKTQEAITAAQCVGRVKWTDGTARMWEETYRELSGDRPGMFGAITARAEAQTVRLAMIYALLDKSANIRRRHLRAAMAVWRYCDTSARFIFGDLIGDPIADAILRTLKQNKAGLSRTDIRDLFMRHAPADKIESVH
jgi:DNA polymerase I-like protein with 3'-5' exonuclease and polymerase domains